MFIQLKLNTDSFVDDYMKAIGRTISAMARVSGIEYHNSFPYIYLDASKEETKELLARFATLGWLGNEVVDTGELVPYN